MDLSDAKKSPHTKVFVLKCHMCGKEVTKNRNVNPVRCFDCRMKYIAANAPKYAKKRF